MDRVTERPSKKTSNVIIHVLFVVFLVYSILPIALFGTTASEGFEFATTNSINSHYSSAVFDKSGYNYETRPGEFILYRLTKNFLDIDALRIGSLYSLLFYILSLISVMIISYNMKICHPIFVGISFLLLFDYTASSSQVSSSNISTSVLIFGISLLSLFFRKGGAILFVAGVFISALATLFRIDLVFILPVAGLIPLCFNGITLRSITVCIFIIVASYVVSFSIYNVIGINIAEVLLSNGEKISLFQNWAIDQIIATLFPFLLPMALIGTILDTFNSGREYWTRSLARAAFFMGPSILLAFIYSGRMDTPRFLVPAMPFLALAGGISVSAFWTAFTRTWRTALVGFCMIAATITVTWIARTPNYVWDGYRFKYATYATPIKTLLLKRQLNDADKLLNNFMREFPDQDTLFIAASWRLYNAQQRFLILNNWTEKGSRQLVNPPISSASIGCLLYVKESQKLELCLAELGREYKSYQQAEEVLIRLSETYSNIYLLTDPAIIKNNPALQSRTHTILESSNSDWDHYTMLLLRMN